MFALTKLWTTATASQRRSWRHYALASSLLGTRGRSYFFFSASLKQAPVTVSVTERLGIGLPQSRMFALRGIFRRRFSGGLVPVNPAGRGSPVPLVPVP